MEVDCNHTYKFGINTYLYVKQVQTWQQCEILRLYLATVNMIGICTSGNQQRNRQLNNVIIDL
jgi:hypothetical protein